MQDHTATVTATGIARLAGVGRAAVSNWRRRHADFPAPIAGTPASPSFELEAVERWLARHGKLTEPSPEEAVRRRIEAFSSPSGVVNALCLAGICLLCAPDADTVPSPASLGDKLRSESPDCAPLLEAALPSAWSKQDHDLIRAVVQVGQKMDASTLFEYLCAQFLRNRRSADVTLAPITDLILDLVEVTDSILDLTCGAGSLLHAAMQRSVSGIDCYGQDSDDAHGRVAAIRLLLARSTMHCGQVIIRQANDLVADPHFGREASAVIAMPPVAFHNWGHEQLAYDPRWTYGGLPPKTEPELAWAQHALSHLTPGGFAALVMPPAAAARQAGRRIRGELVRRGALRAIIALPAGAVSTTSVGLQIWLLQRPFGDECTATHVLLFDSAIARPDEPIEDLRKSVVQAWRTFRDDQQKDVATHPFYRAVPIVDLLDAEVDVTPSRYITQAAPSPHGAIELLTSFTHTLNHLNSTLPALRPTTTDAPERTLIDLDDLVRSGNVLHLRPRQNRETISTPAGSPAVTGPDVIEGRPPSGQARSADETDTIQEGDVLVPVIAKTVLARVATTDQVGAPLGPGVHALRVDSAVLDPWFLAGTISSAANAQRAGRASSTASGALRLDLKRLRVPVLPVNVQRLYGSLFQQIAELETLAARIHEEGQDLATALREALIRGTLEPGVPGTATSNEHIRRVPN